MLRCNIGAPNLLCKLFIGESARNKIDFQPNIPPYVHRHDAVLETDRDVALCKNRQGVHVVGFDEKQRGGQVEWP